MIFDIEIHPKYWASYALRYDFKNPCCSCPAELPVGVNSAQYTESVVDQATTGRDKGMWVASCAQRKCGYYGQF